MQKNKTLETCTFLTTKRWLARISMVEAWQFWASFFQLSILRISKFVKDPVRFHTLFKHTNKLFLRYCFIRNVWSLVCSLADYSRTLGLKSQPIGGPEARNYKQSFWLRWIGECFWWQAPTSCGPKFMGIGILTRFGTWILNALNCYENLLSFSTTVDSLLILLQPCSKNSPPLFSSVTDKLFHLVDPNLWQASPEIHFKITNEREYPKRNHNVKDLPSSFLYITLSSCIIPKTNRLFDSIYTHPNSQTLCQGPVLFTSLLLRLVTSSLQLFTSVQNQQSAPV